MKKKSLFAMKFAVVALAAGFFSPSVTVVKNNVTTVSEGYNVSVSLFNTAEARGRSRGGNRSANKNRNRNSNRNTNKNRNRNVNKNVNVNVHGGGGRYYGGGGYNNNNGAGVAGLVTGMVVGAAIAGSNNP